MNERERTIRARSEGAFVYIEQTVGIPVLGSMRLRNAASAANAAKLINKALRAAAFDAHNRAAREAAEPLSPEVTP